MSYSVDQLKGQISKGKGFAKGNLYRVILPLIPRIHVNLTSVSLATPQSLNVLCKVASMPGRQLLTTERVIGVVSQKVVYGFVNEEINLSFIGLNDYSVRKYFEDWQHYAMNPNTHEVKYKNEYAKTVVVQQLDQNNNVVYGVKLERAFPTQILNIDFSNENSQPLDIGVTLAYTKWTRTDVINDALSTGIQSVLDDVLL